MIFILLLEALLLLVGAATGKPFLGVAAAGGVAYAILAYLHPNVAWGLVWLAFPFGIETLLPGGSALYLPTEPMIFLALAAWAARLLAGAPLRIPKSRLHLPLAALAAATLAASLLGAYPMYGVKALVMASAYVSFGYLYCLVAVDDAARPERLVPWIVGSAAVWGIYGTVKVIAEGVSLRNAYGAVRPFFSEHGGYGAYLAMIFPLALLVALERRGRAMFLYASASIAILLGIVFSFTRAAWVSLAVVLPPILGLWFWWRRSARPLVLLGSAGLVLVLVLAGIGASEGVGRHVESIGEKGDVSNLERLNRWMAATEMLKQHPFFGVGFAAYPNVYHLYRRKVVLTGLAYQSMGPHSEVFRLLSETGFVGFAAACWFLLTAALVGLNVFRWSDDPRVKMLVLAVMAGIGTYAIHGFFRTYLDLEKVCVPFWASFGVIAAMEQGVKRPTA